MKFRKGVFWGLVLVVPFWLAVYVYATDITWSDKSTGDTFSAADANEVKAAVNSKADSTELIGDNITVTDEFANSDSTTTQDVLNDLDQAITDGVGGGIGTDDQVASEVNITDAGGYFTGTETETALQEIGATTTLNTAKVTDDDLGVNENYGPGWNADTGSPEKDDVYDYLHLFDADDDGDFTDEGWFPSTSGAPTDVSYITVDDESATSLSNSTQLSSLLDDTPVNAELDEGVTSNWAYDHVNDADTHTNYVLESVAGTAHIRDAEDSLTNGSNLPDGAAIITYGDANWASGTLPTGSGIPVISGGASWGTTYTLTTLAAALDGEDWSFSGTNNVADNVLFYWGSDNDIGVKYDEVDDRLEFSSNVAADTEVSFENNGAGNMNMRVKGVLYPEGGISTSSANPEVYVRDSDAAGADEADEYAAGFLGNLTTTTEDAEVSDVTMYYMDAGTKTAAFIIDGSDNQVEFQIDTTFQAGDILTAELEADIIDGTKVADNAIGNEHLEDNTVDTAEIAADAVEGTKIADDQVDSEHYVAASIDNEHLADSAVDTEEIAADAVEGTKIADDQIDSEHYVAASIDNEHLANDAVTYEEATGSMKSLTPVLDAAADFAANFTGANLYGGTFVCNVAGTIQLPAVGTGGMNFTIITLGAIAVVVEPNASDLMILDGVALDDADSATNTTTAGDIIVFQYYDATGWLATSNGWTDED